MVLESQSRRGGGRVYGGRRSRHGKVWRTAAAVLVVGGVGYACYVMIAGSDDASNGVVAASANGQDNAAQAAQPEPEPQASGQPAPQPQPQVQPQPPQPQAEPQAQPQAQPQPEPQAPPNDTPTSNTVARRIAQGMDLVQRDQLVEGRALLNEALAGPIADADAARVRQAIAGVNEKLIFSPLMREGDPYVGEHVMEPGGILARIAPRYDVSWRFIAHINRIDDPRRIRAGQRLKIVRGPFHVVVHKSAFRADVYLNGTAAGRRARMFVRSFPVGLGEFDSTPRGQFVVKQGSKLENPEWTNPRTGRRVLADDPTNPIGEHWIGLEGVDENTRDFHRYGLHGTIEPDSIGQQASMGCIRFKPNDIQLLYAMLVEGKSTVTIER